nr:hypothetical protein CFP56_61490 [Quercus suber]
MEKLCCDPGDCNWFLLEDYPIPLNMRLRRQIILGSASCGIKGKVRVRVVNKLGSGMIMNIHCQSHDNDLGYLAVPDGLEVE